MTNKLKQFFTFLFCTMLILSACKKDDIQPLEPPTDTSSNPLYAGNSITTTIGGIVLDYNGTPVSNALITVGDKTGYTNLAGTFNFTNVTVDKKRAYVKIQKVGYFLGSRSFKPSATYNNYVRIQLLTKTNEGNFNNSTGGTINVNGGAKLTFEAGDVSLEDGSAYSGTVTVYASYLDPTASNLGNIMPGDLSALNSSNQIVTLESFGMIAVELMGANGEKLNVANGQTVKIIMPVKAQQAGSAPSTIPLWYFDEAQGNWKEEGQATLQSGEYIGYVSHFSFWNYDYPFPSINFKARFVCSGVPLVNSTVKLTMPSGSSSIGITNGNGEVNGLIPQGVTLLMEVIDECGTVILSQNVPASSTDIDLGNVNTCSSGNQATISGTIVDCGGNPISNGMVRIPLVGNNVIYLYTDPSGSFNSVINICSLSTINVTVYDLDNSTQSATMPIPTGSTINLGTINTCNQIDEYIKYTIDGTQYDIIELGQDEVSSYYYPDTTGITGYHNPDNINLKIGNAVLGNNSCSIYGVNQYQIQFPATINMNITTLGTVPGAYIEGTFNGTFTEAGGGSIHTISGSFRSKNKI